MSRTENSLRNIKFSLSLQIIRYIISFFSRKVFVMVLTQEYLGLDGTFANILSILSLTELGIGPAITYSLYKPLAEGDEKQIAARMDLFRRAYRMLGLVVALLGGCLTPLLPVLIHDLPNIPHIDLIYLLFVLDASLSYFFSYKQSLIIADQRQYITTTVSLSLNILLHVAQTLFLWFTRNYFIYLGLRIGTSLLGNLILSHIADRLYPYIKTNRHEKIEPAAKSEIIKNAKAMICHKVGGMAVFGSDNLLISYFIGVVAVGRYSNYLTITQAMTSVCSQFFIALTASIGNLGVTADSKQVLTVFRRLNFAGNWLYGFSAVCLAVLLNPFIELWLGADYLFSEDIVCLIALNFYVIGMRQAVLTFRDAEGLYWYDRHKPIVEAIVNLTVSAALAVPLGVAGIFIGTFVSTMTTGFWVEPVILFKYGLRTSVKPFFKDYVVNTLITMLTFAAVWHLFAALPGTGVPLFIEKMVVCAVVGNLGYLLVYCRREEFHYFVNLLMKLSFRKK